MPTQLRLPSDPLTVAVLRPMMTSSSIVESLLAAHHDALLAFAERRLGSRAMAEDVVQQASANALGRAEQPRDASAGRAWLFTPEREMRA